MTLLFDVLQKINERPKPYEFNTVADLWADDYVSKQMLACHLNEDIDLSSRNGKFIRRSLEWIVQRFGVTSGTSIADFGCGPGLYALPLARHGASVVGIDFSKRSIDYAWEQAQKENLAIKYVHQDYLRYEPEEQFDLIMMIFCDLCAISPDNRALLLRKFSRHLKPGGHLLLDVCALPGYAERKESSSLEFSPHDGFWTAAPHHVFLNTFKYDTEKIILDKYSIVEANHEHTVYNWLQYFSPDSLAAEFNACGLKITGLFANVAGDPYNESASEFAVIAENH